MGISLDFSSANCLLDLVRLSTISSSLLESQSLEKESITFKEVFAFLKKLDNHPAQFVITDHVEALTIKACTDPDVIEGLVGADPEHLATLDSLQGRR